MGMRPVLLLVLILAVIAGPCQDCFGAPPPVDAHSCCPDRESKPAMNPAACADSNVALDPVKIAVPLLAETVPAPFATIASTPLQIFPISLEAVDASPPIRTLRC